MDNFIKVFIKNITLITIFACLHFSNAFLTFLFGIGIPPQDFKISSCPYFLPFLIYLYLEVMYLYISKTP